MYNQNQLNAMPERIVQRLTQINDDFLTIAGSRIKEIGTLSPSDAQRLIQLRAYGNDIDTITKQLAEISQKNVSDIYEIYDMIAKDNYKFAEQFYNAKGLPYIPYEQNSELKNFVHAMAKQTADTYINMSRNTAFMRFDKKGNKTITSLSKAYSEAIDKAITTVATGVSDYQSQMRSVLKELADSGIQTKYKPLEGSSGKSVHYASGYSRRLDTAVRQNVLWGVKECNQSVAEYVGEEFGADGWEISFHAFPRPTHSDMGGRQYSKDGGKTIKGIYYPPISTVNNLLSDYGCLHFKFPILLGISAPSHTKKELDDYAKQSKRQIEFEGKKYTPYEAKQLQRRTETSIRHAKDRQVIAKASGDDILRRKEQEKINILTDKYSELSKAAGLSTYKERLSVSKYHKVKSK